MDEMLKWLKETAVFMLAAQLIFQFMPGKKFERYGRMLAAVLVLAQVCVPILTLGQEGDMRNFLEQVGELEKEQDSFSEKLSGLETVQEDMAQSGLISSVEEKLKTPALEAGVTVRDVRLRENVLVIYISYDKKESLQEDGLCVAPVEPVEAVPAQEEENGTLAKLAQDFALALQMAPEEVEVEEYG